MYRPSKGQKGLIMAEFMSNRTMNGSMESRRGKGLQVKMQGRSTKTVASLVLSQPCLREAVKDPDSGLWKDSGKILSGKDAADIISKYLKANADRRLANFERDLKVEAAAPNYTVDTRALNGQTVSERASQYLRGKVFQALDACPQQFTVDNTQYRMDTIKMERFLSAADMKAVFDGTKSVGGGTTVPLLTEAPDVSTHFIDEEVFSKAFQMVKDILKPAIKGNTLTLNGHDVITFTDTAVSLSGVEVGSTNFDTDKYTI